MLRAKLQERRTQDLVITALRDGGHGWTGHNAELRIAQKNVFLLETKQLPMLIGRLSLKQDLITIKPIIKLTG